MKRRLLRQPRSVLALTAAIVGFGVLSGGVGSGALPTESLPAFGVTAGDGSLSTVAELGDINGDGIGDYAVGLPSADPGGNVDAGIVYVFLGHAGALPPAPTALNLGSASFTITGHAGEMLGYTIVGDDVNGDHLNDIAIGAPMAGAPGKSGGGAVYVVFGSPTPVNVATTTLSFTGLTTDPVPATSTVGSRYDGFQQNSHTGMSLAALPDVNGDGYNDLAVGAPDADLHTTGGGGVAVLYGKPQGVHITLNDLWEKAYPYFFHIDFPALAEQHVGVSVTSVGDMTGDGEPDIAIGAPQADFNGTDSGSVWIISAHIPPVVGCTQPPVPGDPVAPGSVCPWIKLNGLTAGQGYRIDGAAPGDQLGTSLAGVVANGTRYLAIGAAGATPAATGRAGSGEVVLVPGQSGQATRNLAVTPPLQTVYGAEAGAGLGASLAAAGTVAGGATVLAGAPGEASAGGAAYLLQVAPGTTSDLALASSKINPAGAGSMTGSAVAAGGLALDGAGTDALVAAPGANGSGSWFVVGGSGTPVLPPPPGTPAPPPPPSPPPTPPAPPASPPAPPATTTGTKTTTPTGGSMTTATGTTTTSKPVVKKAKKKLPLCPVKKPKPKYHLVKGKRVKVKPKPCRPRPRAKAKAK
ncbi:MAG TPA: integrin alpha [Gaiellales bacterium]|nr:integrin alpha [Gaiellales bacterium]